MRIIKTADGKEIKTNINEDYSITKGNGRKTMKLELKKGFRETDEEMLERLIRYGYTTITFYHATTAIRGYYDTIAYCK